VALKALPAGFASDPERLARFEREAKLLASLSHPNIATVLSVHEAGGTRYLAMEYVPGEDLAKRIERGAVSAEMEKVRAEMEAARGEDGERGALSREMKELSKRHREELVKVRAGLRELADEAVRTGRADKLGRST